MEKEYRKKTQAAPQGAAEKAQPIALKTESNDAPTQSAPFPIVGVGASAGGLNAFESFFAQLPSEPDMAFIVIQHLDPNHQSELAEILQNYTQMPVTQIQNEQRILPNHVYVIPPGRSLQIQQRVLYLSETAELRERRALIDNFLRTLADDQRENAVCVILSGTGSDGVLGLKRIKEQGGIVLAQTPQSAEHAGMPRSAIGTGIVDLVAPADELARRLVAYRQRAERIPMSNAQNALDESETDTLRRIFAIVKHHTGTDFSSYKHSTILRRLQRRMQVYNIADLDAYLGLLSSDPKEARALFKDFLISVTNFFRDEEAWRALAQQVIPHLFENKGRRDQIRVWVPGCATGEEAYTLGILLLEEADRRPHPPTIQVFATDLDADALTYARAGLYPEAIATDLSSERLKRFFEKLGGGYRVRHELKEIVLFATHNLIEDAPFARIDLISCRNLLIYLERDVQTFVFRLFRYSLAQEGFLFLGTSESAEQVDDLFKSIHKRLRIYRTRPGQTAIPMLPTNADSLLSSSTRPGSTLNNQNETRDAPLTLGDIHQKLMLRRYAPPSVLIDRTYQMRYKFGNVARFLRHQEGAPSLNLLDNVPHHVRVELRTGLYALFRHRENLKPRIVRMGDGEQSEQLMLHIELIEPEAGLEEEMALVIFEPLPPPHADEMEPGNEGQNATLVRQLEEELDEMHHRLQTVVEEYETSNEELKSSNEELQSMNEELRSTTEELETGREELRSTNEELSSLNQELKHKIVDLNRVNSDLENLMEASNIATIFLDRDLSLKRYTPRVTEMFNIIHSDIGRPFSHISHCFNNARLAVRAEQVLKTLQTVEEELKSSDGRHYLMQMQPYRTLEDRIDGVVMTLIDVTDLMAAEEEARIRAVQQAVVAELGVEALRGMSLNALLDTAVQKVMSACNVDCVKVLELLPDQNELLLLSGVGWHEGLVGAATVSAGIHSQAGYTLQSDQPVIVKNLQEEQRFDGPALLHDHGIVSGISVIIQGAQRPFGVLGAHTTAYREFSREDTAFLQGVANVLGAAIEKHAIEEERIRLLARIQADHNRLETIIKQMPGGVIVAEAPSGKLLFFNDEVEKIWRRPNVMANNVSEYSAYPGYRADGTLLASEEWPLARSINTGEIITGEEVIIERGDGQKAIISNSSAPIYDNSGKIVAGVVIFQDVTEARKMASERDRLLQELQTLTATLEYRVEKRTEQLKARSEQLRAMASVLTVAEQRERERISRILHDDLQQLLHAIQMRVTMIETDQVTTVNKSMQEHISAIEQLNDQALTIARSLTIELSPPVLEQGLTEAFAWLAGHMQNVYNLQVEVHVDDGIKLETNDLRELAFQMVRELLFNIVKHAGVQSARLSARTGKNGRCLITIEDEGVGFDVAILNSQSVTNASYGLRSIRERLELFDGMLLLESAPGSGTKITLDLPTTKSMAKG